MYACISAISCSMFPMLNSRAAFSACLSVFLAVFYSEHFGNNVVKSLLRIIFFDSFFGRDDLLLLLLYNGVRKSLLFSVSRCRVLRYCYLQFGFFFGWTANELGQELENAHLLLKILNHFGARITKTSSSRALIFCTCAPPTPPLRTLRTLLRSFCCYAHSAAALSLRLLRLLRLLRCFAATLLRLLTSFATSPTSLLRCYAC